jgi:hypothetical protein
MARRLKVWRCKRLTNSTLADDTEVFYLKWKYDHEQWLDKCLCESTTLFNSRDAPCSIKMATDTAAIRTAYLSNTSPDSYCDTNLLDSDWAIAWSESQHAVGIRGELVWPYDTGPLLIHKVLTWGSVVGMATGYGLDDWGIGVRAPIESRIFSSQNRIYTYTQNTGISESQDCLHA